jgi:hypothetical protein
MKKPRSYPETLVAALSNAEYELNQQAQRFRLSYQGTRHPWEWEAYIGLREQRDAIRMLRAQIRYGVVTIPETVR